MPAISRSEAENASCESRQSINLSAVKEGEEEERFPHSYGRNDT